MSCLLAAFAYNIDNVSLLFLVLSSHNVFIVSSFSFCSFCTVKKPCKCVIVSSCPIFCCIKFLYRLTAIQVTTLLNAIAEVWVIIEILQGNFIRKFLHFLWPLYQILDISNPHEYALSVTKYSILHIPVEAV